MAGAVPLSQYKTPGVYVQEIAKLPASIAQVDTAVPIFIGYTQISNRDGEELSFVPTRITAMEQYVQWFGNPKVETIEVEVEPDPSNAELLILNKVPKRHEVDFRMYYATQMFFNNGGGECYILSIGNYTDEDDRASKIVINDLFSDRIKNILRKELEPTLIVFPDLVNKSSFFEEEDENGEEENGAEDEEAADPYLSIYASALDFCNDIQVNNYFVIMDVEQNEENRNSPLNDAERFRQIAPVEGNDALKYGASYYPYVISSLFPSFNDSSVILKVVSEEPANGNGEEEENGEENQDSQTLGSIRNSQNQLYNQIISAINSQTKLVLPPSGFMAGAYAAIDSTRGVFKTPANIGLANVLAPYIKISDIDNDDFNVDTTAGKSINVIRSFVGRGTLVWGGRTLDGNSREWRYISVRRFFNMVEESVKRALRRFVFEPNNRNTWVSVRASIESFLEVQWRAGALLGNTPKDAFFVRVGMPETFTEAEMLDGFMVVEIGMAVVRPAEFIVLKFMHKFELGQR